MGLGRVRGWIGHAPEESLSRLGILRVEGEVEDIFVGVPAKADTACEALRPAREARGPRSPVLSTVDDRQRSTTSERVPGPCGNSGTLALDSRTEYRKT